MRRAVNRLLAVVHVNGIALLGEQRSRSGLDLGNTRRMTVFRRGVRLLI
jgi:hypothetical protein